MNAVVRHRFPLALLALLAVTIFIAPLLSQQVFTLRDHLDYFQPLRHFTAQELRSGHLPLWNPYNASGEPWLANPQTCVFYPPAWIFLVLPFATAYMLFLLFHLVLLGWGAYLLFVRTASPGAAMVGAAALMFSGPVLSLLDINTILTALAWVPLALWCAAERRPVRGAFALAFVFLAGEPFLAAIAALLYVVVSRKPRDIAITAILAFGISSVQLLPFLELITGSDRLASMSAGSILQDSMSLRDWLRIAIPPSLDASGFDPKLTQHFIPLVYVGVIVIVLALIGLKKTGWLLLLAAVFFLSLGPSFLASLPLTIFRYPARVLPLAALAIAALAVSGWDRIRREKRAYDLLLILVVVADLVWRAHPLLRAEPFRRDIVPYAKSVGADSKILRVGDIDPARRPLWIAGYLNLYDRRFDAFTAAPLSNERYMRIYRNLLEHPTRDQLDVLPAGYILSSLALPQFEPVARAQNVIVYRNRGARPMAALMTRNGVIAAKLEIGTSRAHVIVDAADDGVLVVAQQDAKAWSVRVDGKDAEKRRIFGLFLGVAVPKGRHEIVFRYRSRSLFAGGAMTLVTLLSIPLFAFVKTRK